MAGSGSDVNASDSDTTPIARKTDAYLLASTVSSTFAGSYVAPQALLNAILRACAELEAGRSLKMLRQSETEYLSGPRWYESVPETPGAREKRRPVQKRAAARRRRGP